MQNKFFFPFWESQRTGRGGGGGGQAGWAKLPTFTKKIFESFPYAAGIFLKHTAPLERPSFL